MPHSTAVFFDFENYVLSSDMDAFTRHYESVFADKVREQATDFAFMKAYADWSMPRFRAFARFITDNGIEPVQVFGYSFNQDSKNIADFIMTLDIFETAMTKPHIENFVIVTGDAGFSVIINRLRGLGKRVILYRPDENCSRYLEHLADICLCMDTEQAKEIMFTPPVSDKPLVLECPFSPQLLPEEDKTDIRLTQPDNIRKLEGYGIKPSRENVRETIRSLLRCITPLGLYENSPFTVISVSRLSALIEIFVVGFNFRNYGHKTITKYLNDVLKGTPYALARRNKDSLYYVVASEAGLAEAYPNLEIKYTRGGVRPAASAGRQTSEQPPRGGDAAEQDNGVKKSEPAVSADVQETSAPLSSQAGQPAPAKQAASSLPLDVNITVPLSNRTIIIAKPFEPALLPDVDKQNAKIMQPRYLKNLEVYGLVKYGELSGDQLNEFLQGILKILTLLNLYPQHPQIVTSISLLTLLMEFYIEDFSAKKYGYPMFSKLIESLAENTEFSLVRKDANAQYYVIVSEKGLRDIHPDVTVVMPKTPAAAQPASSAPDAAPPASPVSDTAPPAQPASSPPATPASFAPDTAPPAGARFIAPAFPVSDTAPPATPAARDDERKPARGRKAKPAKHDDRHTAFHSDKAGEQSERREPEQPASKPQQKNKRARGFTPAVTPEFEPAPPEFTEPLPAPAQKKPRVNDFYVRRALTERIKKDRLTDGGINELTDKEYCGRTFQTPLPLLKEVSLPLASGQELDENGKKVYWKRVFKYKDRHFLIYGDWKDGAQKDALIRWAEG